MADLSGQYLGRYNLSERLGEGGMAVVYKAYDTRLERDVAVKIIRSGAFPLEAMDEVSKRFEREAKSLAKLSHPNIVKVHDYGEHEGSPYLVMEYLPGGTLKKVLGKPLPWQTALRLLLPVARGVAYAHQRGILHRDIKPANVLITENGDPMLSDFGIAKLFEGDQTTHLTGTGMVIGTPEYMAPEQWTGQPTVQSDLYSLGIVLYEMVAGRKPYTANTPASILLKQATEPLPPPRKFAAGIPEAVEFLLVKALAREPGDRFADVNALIQAMETLLVTAPTVQAPHSDPDILLKETLVGPSPASIATEIEPQTGGKSILPPAASASSPSMPKGQTIPPTTGQTGSFRSMTQPRRPSQFGLFAIFGGAGLMAVLGIGVIILIFLPGILRNSAQPVPTATFSQVTPTVLAASATSTPDKTPQPELGFTIVEPQEVLQISSTLKTLGDLAVEKYSNSDTNTVNLTLTYTVHSKPDVPLVWSSGWCAVNDQTLQQNLARINFVFKADGYEVPLERLAANTYEATASNMKGWKCQEYLTVLRDWKPGTYKLVETINFLSAINDGQDAFDPGRMIRQYTVTITE
jgi:serine/threonine protein kinase